MPSIGHLQSPRDSAFESTSPATSPVGSSEKAVQAQANSEMTKIKKAKESQWRLPQELIARICEHLPANELAHAMGVSRI